MPGNIDFDVPDINVPDVIDVPNVDVPNINLPNVNPGHVGRRVADGSAAFPASAPKPPEHFTSHEPPTRRSPGAAERSEVHASAKRG